MYDSVNDAMNEKVQQELIRELEKVRTTVKWFRSSRSLRIYYAITSLPREHLSLIDRFIENSYGLHEWVCDDDRLRQLITSCLFLLGCVKNEIMPILNRELVQVGPGRKSESLTQLKLTREAGRENAIALETQLCNLRVATLRGCPDG